MTSICKVVITLLRVVSLCNRWLWHGVVLISHIRIVHSLGVPVLLGCFLCEEWLLAYSTHLLLQNHVDSAPSFSPWCMWAITFFSSSSWSCCSIGGSCVCQNQFLWWTLMKAEGSRRAYASLGTRQEGRRFEDIGLSLCASPLQILVLGFQRTEFQWSAVGLKVSGGIRKTEETEEFVGSIQCDIWTEELPPQHAQYLYYTAET